MSRPLIGITTYGRTEENHFTVPVEYVDSVRRAGGVPVLFPPGETHTGRWLAAVDAVILAGGGDLDPALYGGAQHEQIYMLDDERDSSEIAVARDILSSGLPTLGICRGTQIINVALGGTLIEHLPDEVGDDVLHRLPPREPTPHTVEIEANSGLAAILEAKEFAAASWHHQAIRKVGRGLEVVARAPDGTIEAVEKQDHQWLFAVQWHPELTAADDPVQQRLFDALIKAAGRNR